MASSLTELSGVSGQVSSEKTSLKEVTDLFWTSRGEAVAAATAAAAPVAPPKSGSVLVDRCSKRGAGKEDSWWDSSAWGGTGSPELLGGSK